MLKNGFTYFGLDGQKKALKVQNTSHGTGAEIMVTFGTYGIGEDSKDVLWDNSNIKILSRRSATKWAKEKVSEKYEKYKRKLISGAKHCAIDLIKRFTNKSYYTIINSIEWGTENLWEMRCSDIPKPFKTFCPINLATLQLTSVNSTTMNVANCSFEYISGTNPRKITVTLNDDSVGTMQRWFYTWMEEISSDGRMGGVTPLENCGRLFTFVRYCKSKEEVGSYSLYCFPVGVLTEDNSQSVKAREFTIELAVAGMSLTYKDYSELEFLQPNLVAWKLERLAKRTKLYNKARNLYYRGEGIVSTINGIIS